MGFSSRDEHFRNPPLADGKPTPSNMISINGLIKNYDSVLAVDGLDLNVLAGELFGFLGPNGAGKTITIKLLVGLLKPTSGTIHIDGIDLKKEPLQVKKSLAIFPTDLFFTTSLQDGNTWSSLLTCIRWTRKLPMKKRKIF